MLDIHVLELGYLCCLGHAGRAPTSDETFLGGGHDSTRKNQALEVSSQAQS